MAKEPIKGRERERAEDGEEAASLTRTVDIDSFLGDSEAARAQYTKRREIKAIGHAIRQMRVDSGLTQAALAERLGTTQSHVSELERGAGREGPSMTLYFRIMRACGRETLAVDLADESPVLTTAKPAAPRPVAPSTRSAPGEAEVQSMRTGALWAFLDQNVRGRFEVEDVLRVLDSVSPMASLAYPLIRRGVEIIIEGWSEERTLTEVASELDRFEAMTLREAVEGSMGFAAKGRPHGRQAKGRRIVEALSLQPSWNEPLSQLDKHQIERARIAVGLTSLSARTAVDIVRRSEDVTRSLERSRAKAAFLVQAA